MVVVLWVVSLLRREEKEERKSKGTQSWGGHGSGVDECRFCCCRVFVLGVCVLFGSLRGRGYLTYWKRWWTGWLKLQIKPHINHSFPSECLSAISIKMFKTIWGQGQRKENVPRYLSVLILLPSPKDCQMTQKCMGK